MRIPIPLLFTIPNFHTAGSGQVLVNIVKGLDKARFVPVICVLSRGGRLETVLENLGILIFEAPFTVSAKPYFSLLYRVRKAAQVFRPYRFAIWHSFDYSDTYTEALLAYFSGVNRYLYTKKSMSWGSRAWLLKSYLATHIVADNTDMVRGMFNRVGLGHKISYIPHGVDTDKFRPGLFPRLCLREKFNIPLQAPLIVCVAELLPVKGHPTLLAALAHIPDAHLLLAGRPMDADYALSLELQVETLGLRERVHFLGSVEDVPALLAESDIFVLPTWGKGRMEGCPVALLEAMACGKACVASDIPGSHDVIEHQVNGWLVLPENVGALAGGLQRLIKSPELRETLGDAARQRIVSDYTVDREANDYARLYQGLLGTRFA